MLPVHALRSVDGIPWQAGLKEVAGKQIRTFMEYEVLRAATLNPKPFMFQGFGLRLEFIQFKNASEDLAYPKP